MSKFGPFERMGAREAQRRAWREAVARAAEEWREAEAARLRNGESWGESDLTMEAWCAAHNAASNAAYTLRTKVAEPKPWTRPAKADLGKLHKLLNAPFAFRISFPGGWGGECCVKSVKPKIRARLRRKRRAAQRRRR